MMASEIPSSTDTVSFLKIPFVSKVRIGIQYTVLSLCIFVLFCAGIDYMRA